MNPFKALFCAVLGCLFSTSVSYGWTYDPSTKTITDGDWVFNVSVSGTEMTVNTVKTTPTVGLLDLSTPVDGGAYTITRCGNRMIRQCSVVTEVRLPSTLQRIDAAAFEQCPNLTTVTPFLPESVTFVDQYAFNGSTALTGDLALLNDSVTLGNTGYQFNKTAVTSADLGLGVTIIPQYTFGKCDSLTNVVFRGPVKQIGMAAFEHCNTLRTLTPFLPDTLEVLGSYAFTSCDLLEGDLSLGGNGQPFRFDGKQTFDYSRITSLDCGAGVTNIPEQAFGHCAKMTNIVFRGPLQAIIGPAFEHCTNLVSITPLLPESLQRIGKYAFVNCPIEGELVLGKKTNCVIETYAFNNTKLGSVTLGEEMTSVAERAFIACKQLTNVVLRSAINLGQYCFSDGVGSRDIYMVEKPTNINSSFSCSSCILLYHLNRDRAQWQEFMADTTKVTPWETLSSSVQASYTSRFGEAPLPMGRTKTASGYQEGWVLPWSVPVPQEIVTTIFIR